MAATKINRQHQAECAASAAVAADRFDATGTAAGARTANLMDRIAVAHLHYAEGHASAKVGVGHCPDCG